MEAGSHSRFVVVDLGTQIADTRRFAVWDTTVLRFWKINNHQTWGFVDDLLADFDVLMPEPRFQPVFLAQCDELAEQAASLGFDPEED